MDRSGYGPELYEFNLFVSDVKPAVIAVVETWFKDTLHDSLLCPRGYSLFRKDRATSDGGGVAFFVRKDILINEIDLGSDGKHLDILCLDLLFGCQSLRVILCYHPPYYTAEDFMFFSEYDN